GAAILLARKGWSGTKADAPQAVMTIALGGAGEGPLNGGMTKMGGRAIQEARAPEEAPKREAVRPPAAKVPEMTLPAPNAKTTKVTPRPTVAQAPDDARGRTPTKGAQTLPGSTI